MTNYINDESYKCLFGTQTKSIQKLDNLITWKVGKVNHFTVIGDLTTQNISDIINIGKTNFHYLSQSNIDKIKHLKPSKQKGISIELPVNTKYIGRKYHDIRNYINRYTDKFEVLDNYKNIDDVKVMINEWAITLGEKYFRMMGGKNTFYYKSNYHKDCLNTFVYDNNKLISFGTLSPGEESAYIIGKALSKSYPGLAEFTDHLCYVKAEAAGVKIVNLGQATKGLVNYKNKFPNATEVVHYHGSID